MKALNLELTFFHQDVKIIIILTRNSFFYLHLGNNFFFLSHVQMLQPFTPMSYVLALASYSLYTIYSVFCILYILSVYIGIKSIFAFSCSGVGRYGSRENKKQNSTISIFLEEKRLFSLSVSRPA